jgi:hypothetical protein
MVLLETTIFMTPLDQAIVRNNTEFVNHPQLQEI